MQTTKTTINTTQFAKDVKTGLGKMPKSIPSKYFYDEKGDRIFQQIMNMPEYYLTRAEFEILAEQRMEICDALDAFKTPFNLIEFGAGDGLKTKLLLRYLLDEGAGFTYYPVDISNHILSEFTTALHDEFPGLKTHAVHDDYFGALQQMRNFNDRRNVVLFLGSNIGNFHYADADHFLHQMAKHCQPGDLLLLGVDLKKDPKLIIQAYDDPHGITAAFNLNLLKRMNAELGADFQPGQFDHYVSYEPQSGEVLSYLISKKDQTIVFSDLDLEIEFSKHELIHTEISKKYSLTELEKLARETGYEPVSHFLDTNNYFTDSLLKISGE